MAGNNEQTESAALTKHAKRLVTGGAGFMAVFAVAYLAVAGFEEEVMLAFAIVVSLAAAYVCGLAIEALNHRRKA